jgi:hypothetical protein
MPCLHVCKLVIDIEKQSPGDLTGGNRECDVRDATGKSDVAVKVAVVGMAVLVAVSAIGPSGIVATADVTLLHVTVIGTP